MLSYVLSARKQKTKQDPYEYIQDEPHRHVVSAGERVMTLLMRLITYSLIGLLWTVLRHRNSWHNSTESKNDVPLTVRPTYLFWSKVLWTTTHLFGTLLQQTWWPMLTVPPAPSTGQIWGRDKCQLVFSSLVPSNLFKANRFTHMAQTLILMWVISTGHWTRENQQLLTHASSKSSTHLKQLERCLHMHH